MNQKDIRLRTVRLPVETVENIKKKAKENNFRSYKKFLIELFDLQMTLNEYIQKLKIKEGK